MNAEAHFFRVKTAQKVGRILAQKIKNYLSRGQVLWLLSGGSSLDIAVECANQLHGSNLSRLAVSLVDERYGPSGHADSNWQQLEDKGFDLPKARLTPFLRETSFDETLDELRNFFRSALKSESYKIALLGMGADGHTAGILPGSPAAVSDDLISGYQADDYWRMTLTLKGLQRLDEAILYAVGDTKAAQLSKLVEPIEPALQPAQIIKRLPRWAVYNDRIGEET